MTLVSGWWRTARLSGRALLTVLLPATVIAACEAGEPPPGDASPSSAGLPAETRPDSAADTTPAPRVELVDSGIAPAVAGEDGWMYSQSAEADLDGDGIAERVVITARAEIIRGRPAWDDGQPWQVYVEEPDGHRTYLFARFVQLGKVTMRVGREVPGHPPTVVLIEHVPDRVAIYEIEYEGPDSARAVTRFERLVDPTGDLASPDLP